MEDWHALLGNMNRATIKVEKGRSIFYTNLYIAILVLFILILLRRDHNMTAIGNATAFLLLVEQFWYADSHYPITSSVLVGF